MTEPSRILGTLAPRTNRLLAACAGLALLGLLGTPAGLSFGPDDPGATYTCHSTPGCMGPFAAGSTVAFHNDESSIISVWVRSGSASGPVVYNVCIDPGGYSSPDWLASPPGSYVIQFFMGCWIPCPIDLLNECQFVAPFNQCQVQVQPKF